jgi:hypothetical protein
MARLWVTVEERLSMIHDQPQFIQHFPRQLAALWRMQV